MSTPNLTPRQQETLKLLKSLTTLVVLVSALAGLLAVYLINPNVYDVGSLFPDEKPMAAASTTDSAEDTEKVENGIHVSTGLVYDDRFDIVRSSCTACHSAKLITQNRMSRENWKKTIVWMQETQKLWDLGPNEDKILDYLAEYYAPEEMGRRKNLEVEEWYMLD